MFSFWTSWWSGGDEKNNGADVLTELKDYFQKKRTKEIAERSDAWAMKGELDLKIHLRTILNDLDSHIVTGRDNRIMKIYELWDAMIFNKDIVMALFKTSPKFKLVVHDKFIDLKEEGYAYSFHYRELFGGYLEHAVRKDKAE